MKKTILFCFIFAFFQGLFAQKTYFPPTFSNTWEKTDPATLNWCSAKIDPFYTYLEQTNTKAFIALKDGRIVLEKYFGTFKQDSSWYWASAGKTVTSSLIGIAQEEGLLNIKDLSSKYLGKSWTSLPAAKEDLITIRHQLTMTTGFDDTSECLDPACLIYKADAGTRWSYHNAPYTLLDKVIEKASGVAFNQYYKTKIQNKIGMDGLFLKIGNNNINFSTARSMARYGLLLANNGKWETNQVIPTKYLSEALNTSQNLNLSYGYLWWLNGKASAMAPGSQLVFPGSLAKDAPNDMYSALGKNGQIINVVPSLGLVLIRMGNSDGLPVPITYDNTIWQKFNEIIKCKPSSINNFDDEKEVVIFPNPATDEVSFSTEKNISKVIFTNLTGQDFTYHIESKNLNISNLAKGLYLVNCIDEQKNIVAKKRFVKL